MTINAVGGSNLHRILAILALFALFNLLVFSTLAGAQVPQRQSKQFEENTNGKNVVSLTTTDLLSTQDFAPTVNETPATRRRIVHPGKVVKDSVNVKPLELGEGKGKKGLKAATDNQTAIGTTIADVMRPTTMPVTSNAETEVEPQVSKWPVTNGNGSFNLDELVSLSAKRNGVDHRLILAVMQQESSFNPRATSYKGARGLMQLMPATASRFGVTDIYDPAQNIEGGARYLRFLLDTFNGDIELALAGYNAGEHAVSRYGNRIPPYRETQDYVRKISAHYDRLTNGGIVRRSSATIPPAISKKPDTGFITAGSTMTQF